MKYIYNGPNCSAKLPEQFNSWVYLVWPKAN